jgi:glucose/arabinose dehydrogenase
MKNKFLLFVATFFIFFNSHVIFAETDKKIIKKRIEGINFPVQILKNEFISKDSIFVLEHRPGAIIEIQNFNNDNVEPKINTILDLESLVTEVDNWEPGVMGFAFSPSFQEDRLIFVTYSNKKNQLVLSKFIYNEEKRNALISSEEKILVIDRFHPIGEQDDHVGGTIKFNPIDNHLYLSSGDNRRPDQSQNINKFYGKILRINPFIRDNDKNYSSVKENPFMKIQGEPEILFIGFRNPWSFSFDSETGDIYIPDVGSEYIEELNIVKYNEFNNFLNFGWSCFEGTYNIYNKHYDDVAKSKKLCETNIKNTSIKFIEPSIQYFHDSIVKTDSMYGNSITGGALYKNISSIWHNHYFFGDLTTSNIWFIDTSKKENIAINLSYGEDLGLTSIVQIDDKLFGTSYMGAIYEIILPDGKNYEKSIYNRPLITKNLSGMKFMNENNHTIFTHGSGFYKLLKQIRHYLDLLPF